MSEENETTETPKGPGPDATEVLGDDQFDEDSLEAILHESNESDPVAEAPESDEDETVGSVEDVLAEAIDNDIDDADEPEVEVEAEGSDDEPVTLTRADYLRLMKMANGEDVFAEAETPAAPAQAAEAPAPPAPEPISTEAFKFPENEDDFIEVLGTPDGYKKHMQAYANQIQMQTIAAMEPLIINRVMEGIAATKFDEAFYEQNPHLVDYPEISQKAVAAAVNKLGRNAPWKDLLALAGQNARFAKATADNIVKSRSRTRDVRGRNAPATSRQKRPGAPGAKPPKQDPYVEAANGSFTPMDAQLLQDVGVL